MIKTRPASNSLLGLVSSTLRSRATWATVGVLLVLVLLYSRSPLRNLRISLCLRRAPPPVVSSQRAGQTESGQEKAQQAMFEQGVVPAKASMALNAPKAIPLNAPIMFGVVLVVEKDPDDPELTKIQVASYRGIGHLSIPEWVLFYVGVGFDKADEAKTLQLLKKFGVPEDKVVMLNSVTNGAEAWNIALDAAERHPHVTHIAPCGVYDLWFPDHLKHIRNSISSFPDAGFVFAQVATTQSYIYPLPRPSPEKKLNNLMPVACLVPVTVSTWQLARFNPRMRTAKEQESAHRLYKNCCSMQCTKGTVLPFLEDLVDRVTDLFNLDALHVYFAQIVTARTYAETLAELKEEVPKYIDGLA